MMALHVCDDPQRWETQLLPRRPPLVGHFSSATSIQTRKPTPSLAASKSRLYLEPHYFSVCTPPPHGAGVSLGEVGGSSDDNGGSSSSRSIGLIR